MTDIEIAKQKLHADSLAFVIAKNGVILRTGTQSGIGELIDAVETLGDAAHQAVLADKIVGKAVAMVARTAQIRQIYSPLMSQAACDALKIDQISYEYGRLVPLILNKRNDGLCPMEQLTLPIADPGEAVAALRNFIHRRA